MKNPGACPMLLQLLADALAEVQQLEEDNEKLRAQ